MNTPTGSLKLRMRTHYNIHLTMNRYITPERSGALDLCLSANLKNTSLAHKKGKTGRLPLKGSTCLSRSPYTIVLPTIIVCIGHSVFSKI